MRNRIPLELLEPRAVAAARAMDVAIHFFLACCALGLLMAISGWAMRVLPEVIK